MWEGDHRDHRIIGYVLLSEVDHVGRGGRSCGKGIIGYVLLSEVDHVGRGIIGCVLFSEVDHVGRGS